MKKVVFLYKKILTNDKKCIKIIMMVGGETMLHIKISDELKQQLKEEADRLEMTLNGYIRMLLIERKK